MLYKSILSRIHQLNNDLNIHNYKEIKQSLIGIQNQISTAKLAPAERNELKDSVQAVFEIIKTLQLTEKQLFEKEATKNFDHLKQMVIEAIDFTQNNLNDHEAVWQKLIAVQQNFKGKKLIADQREQLFGTLQKLFEILKKRRSEELKEKEKEMGLHFDKLDDEVAFVVGKCRTDDVDKAWADLLFVKDKVLNSNVVHNHRKKLVDKLQQGFDILKDKKEERHFEILEQTTTNAEAIREQLKFASIEMETNSEFSEKWDLLLAIQQEFRTRKLDKEARNVLYDELQDLFQRLKSEQYSDQSEFEQLADENVNYLRPLVDKAIHDAQTSMDFKKTKVFLIKVQSDFKGRKMRSFEREKLFARLQNAFEILNSRMEEYVDSRKNARVMKAISRRSDMEMKIGEIEKSLNLDLEKLERMEAIANDSQLHSESSTKVESQQNMIKIMHAAIARKNAELEVLQNDLATLMQNKEDQVGE